MPAPPPSRWKQLGWFVALWAAGVLSLTLLGYTIKLLLVV